MACNLPKLKEQLAALAKNGIVNGIPLEIAMIRMTSAYTERMNAVMNKEGSKASKNAAKVKAALVKSVGESKPTTDEQSSTGKDHKSLHPQVLVGNILGYLGPKSKVVITTNLGGVHGAGLAKAASMQGLIKSNNVNFDSSPSERVFTVAVKGKESSTAKVSGKAYSEQTTKENVELLKSEMRKVYMYAKANPEVSVYIPLVGMGFGEGDINEIGPVIVGMLELPNVKLVVPSADILAAVSQAKVRKDNTAKNLESNMEWIYKNLGVNTKDSTTIKVKGSGKPEDYTIHSGGAYGADTFWGIIGKQFGVKSKHYKSDKSPYVSQTLKADGQVHTPLTDAQIDEGIPEAKRAAELLGHNWTSDVEKQRLLARNWFQVKNADAVYAVAEIKGEYVKGGTGYAVAMAVAHGKPVYVFDPVQGKWYMRDTNSWKPLTKAPPLTQNFAGIGTRTVEQYNVKNKEGKWVPNPEYLGKEVEEKVKAAIREAFENTFTNGQVPTEIKSDNNILSKKTLGGKEVITFADGKGAKIINSLDELVELAEEYNSLVTGAVDESSVKLVQSTFRTLGKMGIEFKPIKVSITRAKVDSNERGLYDINGNVIQLFFNNTHTNASPAQVLLHEYIHAITMQGLKDNPELKAKVEALMAHVNKNDSSMYFNTTEGKSEGVYGMKDANEFLAEAIASPEFREKLAKIPPYESKNVLDVVKQWFKELLENLRVKDVKEVNALTEALELVIEVAETQAGKTIKSKDVAQVGDQIGDQKTEPENKHSALTLEEWVDFYKGDGTDAYISSDGKLVFKDQWTGSPDPEKAYKERPAGKNLTDVIEVGIDYIIGPYLASVEEFNAKRLHKVKLEEALTFPKFKAEFSTEQVKLLQKLEAEMLQNNSKMKVADVSSLFRYILNGAQLRNRTAMSDTMKSFIDSYGDLGERLKRTFEEIPFYLDIVPTKGKVQIDNAIIEPIVKCGV